LEWNNSEPENDNERVAEDDVSGGSEDGVSQQSPNKQRQRDRQPLTWIDDYVSGEGLSEDEIHMALMVSSDPACFEDVVKSSSWRLAMDDEIKSITKNHTWTLIELPTGVK